MNKIRFKELVPVLAILLVVLVLVLIRSMSSTHFRQDAAGLAKRSIDGSNIITVDKVAGMAGEKLVVNLSAAGNPGIAQEKQVRVAPESILEKQNLKLFRKNNCSVLLWSDEPSVSAKTWMLLSQMGYGNVFILQTGADNESLKIKFRPDTSIVRPEL